MSTAAERRGLDLSGAPEDVQASLNYMMFLEDEERRLRAVLVQAIEELRGHDDHLSNQELRDTVDDFIAAGTAALSKEQP